MKSISRHIKRISEARVLGKDSSKDNSEIAFSPKSNIKTDKFPLSTTNKKTALKTFTMEPEKSSPGIKIKVQPAHKNMATVMRNYHVQSNVNTSISPIAKLKAESNLILGQNQQNNSRSGVSFNELR